ncbi:MAG: DUF3616 domain-containing protein [Verrucomicrobia bacterium]|nr:DUF3616 domain-containing protein [Verrucomicrobiota bacterium]
MNTTRNRRQNPIVDWAVAEGLLGGVVLALAAGSCARAADPIPAVSEYSGMCDASAAVGLGRGLFAVANDEDNILRIYDGGRAGHPVWQSDFTAFLRASPDSTESDLEAAARIGDRIYWMTSHGRNKKGKERASRHRFFATEIVPAGGGFELRAAGQPYDRLLIDLISAPELGRFRLGAASTRAPKSPGALNIEGMAADEQGRMWIGFRNPIPEGRALLVRLQNPSEMIAGQGASIGEAVLLDLGGLGIRELARSGGYYWIIAGPYDEKKRFALYRWAGDGAPPVPIPGILPAGLNPEALAAHPDRPAGVLQVFSDDGGVEFNGVACKDLPDPWQRRFRSGWIVLPDR